MYLFAPKKYAYPFVNSARRWSLRFRTSATSTFFGNSIYSLIMSPGILYIYPGLIVPIRFTISIALFFIAVKANVVAFYQGRDWSECPGHPLLLATALINSILSGLSLILSLIRDEDKLPPRVRWNCAAIGAVVRFFLFQLTLSTAIKTANNGLAGSFRLNEFVLAEVTLSLLLWVHSQMISNLSLMF